MKTALEHFEAAARIEELEEAYVLRVWVDDIKLGYIAEAKKIAAEFEIGYTDSHTPQSLFHALLTTLLRRGTSLIK